MINRRTSSLPVFVILAINVFIFVFNYGEGYGELLVGGYSPGISQSITRYIMSMFMHSGFEHLYNNMIVLLIFGINLCRIIGGTRFLILYFIGGYFASLSSIYYYGYFYPNSLIRTIGASGAIYAIMGAYLVLVISNKGRLLISNKINFIIIIFGGILVGKQANVNSAAHLGGLIAGIIVMIIYIIINRKKRYV